MNHLELIKKLSTHGINLNQEQIKQIELYKTLLQQKNKEFNLTRLDTQALFYEKYVYWGVLPFLELDLNHKSILDIGSGSGNPGLLLKILFPQMHLTIIESNNKRVAFMKLLANQLGFSDITFIAERAECVSKQYYNKFDYVTSRAVASVGVLVEISCQFLKTSGYLIEPKSNSYEQELDLIKLKLDDYGLVLETIDKKDDKNVVLWFKKTKQPNDIYPREWKIIIKEYK